MLGGKARDNCVKKKKKEERKEEVEEGTQPEAFPRFSISKRKAPVKIFELNQTMKHHHKRPKTQLPLLKKGETSGKMA